MSATLAQIRAGLATALEDALPTTGGQASAYMLDNPSPPTLQVMGPEEVQYDQAMARGLDEWTLVVQAFSGSPSDRAAQELLDGWYVPNGSTSVKSAIETDRTLGGIIEDLQVVRASGYRIYNLPNRTEALGAEFFVRILNTGT